MSVSITEPRVDCLYTCTVLIHSCTHAVCLFLYLFCDHFSASRYRITNSFPHTTFSSCLVLSETFSHLDIFFFHLHSNSLLQFKMGSLEIYISPSTDSVLRNSRFGSLVIVLFLSSQNWIFFPWLPLDSFGVGVIGFYL